jgi:hypothetical protein
MDRLRRFLRLPLADQWLLLKSSVLLASVRILLWMLPFPTARRLIERVGRESARLTRNPAPAKHFAWAVSAAGSVVPGGGHCLSQALTLQVFLLRRGYPCRVRYGVYRQPGAAFTAHAWVEHQGTILIGGDNLGGFVELAPPADSPS